MNTEWFKGHEGHMTAWECMNHDNVLAGLWILSKFLIIAFYFSIAIYSLLRYYDIPIYERTKRNKGALKLALVFSFCGVAGYLIPLLRIWWTLYWTEVIVSFMVVVAAASLLDAIRDMEFFSKGNEKLNYL